MHMHAKTLTYVNSTFLTKKMYVHLCLEGFPQAENMAPFLDGILRNTCTIFDLPSGISEQQ